MLSTIAILISFGLISIILILLLYSLACMAKRADEGEREIIGVMSSTPESGKDCIIKRGPQTACSGAPESHHI